MPEWVLRPCPVCGNADDSHVFAEAHLDEAKLDEYAFASRKIPEYMHRRLVECPTCDALYATPVPPPDSLAEAYHEAAFDSREEAHFAARTYASLLEPILARLPSRSGALDIGTGDGAFLEELRALDFSDVMGVEPSSAPIAQANADVRPLIRHGIFCREDYPASSLHLVTCFQTLEHLFDPMVMCRAALEILKPGGAVCFVCHDRRALSARILGKRSPIFDIEHLQLFSERSATELLARAGYSNIVVKPIVNRYPAHYWAKLSPIPSRMKPMLVSFMKRARLGNIPISIPAGNLVAIGFKPPSS